MSPTSSRSCRRATTLNGKTFKVHLDGYNLIPFFKGEAKELPREGFFYWSDDGDLMALRVRDWKIAFLEQNTERNPEAPLWVSGRANSPSCAHLSSTICAPTRSSAVTESIILRRLAGPSSVHVRAGAGHRWPIS